MTSIMVTGSRDVHYPGIVLPHLEAVFDMFPTITAISGGAPGADSLWATAAANRGVPFHVYLPNRYFRDHYPGSISDGLLAVAEAVFHIVDRPDVPNWRKRWDAQSWWRDNHKRNAAMVRDSEKAVVVCRDHPSEVMKRTGSTASTLRELHRVWPDRLVWWVPDGPSISPQPVTLGSD